MQIIDNIASMRQFVQEKKGQKSIGLVPTMGALHRGHLSLIEACRKENDVTICSIFVNPKQFNNPEDLAKYPRDLAKDCQILAEAGCDAVFAPTAGEMYNDAMPVIKISYGYLEDIMEGKYRPGHFNGVGIVVMKLFNIAVPDMAYFGQKDLQQFVIIKHLVQELNIQLTLRCMPIIREADGLAMSSRNARLKGPARMDAAIFYKAINQAEEMLINKHQTGHIRQAISSLFEKNEGTNLEYFEIVNAQDLTPLSNYEIGNTALCIAGYVDGVRLIDNKIL